MKVAIVTGGSSGIGLATATKFAESGFHVVISARDSGRLSDARTKILERGAAEAQCEILSLDMAEADRAGDVVDFAVERFGRADVVVSNAAVAPMKPFVQIDAEEFENAININIRSVYYLFRAAWKQMTKQDSGTLIFISSLAAVDPFPGFSIYGSSKAWGDLLVHSLAGEGKSNNIRVFSVRPGVVETPLLRSLFPEFPADEALDPVHVAQLIEALCDDRFQYTSGQAIAVRR